MEIDLAVELRRQGLSYAKIGRILGISHSTAHELVTDPDGAKRRARQPVRPRRPHPRKRWTQEIIIDRVHRWEQRHGRKPTGDDWRRHNGDVWPCTGTVIYYFGKWSAAMTASDMARAGAGPGT